RDRQRHPYPVSPAHRRARNGRDHLERPVRPVRAAGRRRHDACPPRHPVRRMRVMTVRSRASVMSVVAILAALGLAGCDDKPTTYQGWIEANLIFVGPDESGRVETLNVREGDKIEAGAPLFTLDTELHRADLNMNQATLANAKQTFDRAQSLARTGAGTQKDFDAAQAALREAEARGNPSQARLARRSIKAPVTGTVQQVYFRPGEMVVASRPIVALLPPGNMKVRFFVPQAELPRIAYGDTVTVRCDGCTGDLTAKVSF